MASYTIKNLKQDVEDQAVAFGLSPQVEARFAYDALNCEQTGVSYQRLAPSAEQPFAHRHGEVEEVYVILSGGGRVRLDDDVLEVSQWDAVRVAPQTVRMFAAGPDGLEFLAFGPRGVDESEMLPADWPA